MFTIWKEFSFSAAHHLEGLPDDHPCARVHGHNYIVEIELRTHSVDDVGFVLDYRSMDRFKAFIDTELDHRDLNEVLDRAAVRENDDHSIVALNPTAENLAAWLYAVARGMFEVSGVRVSVSAVRVRETEKTCAEFRPS